MLRKTYRLMQKTTHLMSERGDDLLRLAVHPLQSLGHARAYPKIAFHACPPDIWPGLADQGRALVDFVARLDDPHLDLVVGPRGTDHIDPGFHHFAWLHDLRTLPGDKGRMTAARILTHWAQVNSETDSLLPSTLEASMSRVFHLIGTYAFYAPALTPEGSGAVLTILTRDLQVCKRALVHAAHPLDAFYASATLLAGAVALLYDAPHTPRYLQQFEKALTALVLSDGGPHTRRPGDLPPILKTLINLRHLLTGAGVPVPAMLAHGIDRVVPALRFFCLGDGGLAVFHGSGEGDPQATEQVLQLAHMNARAPASLPYTGFERLTGGASTVIIDSGAPGPGHHASTTAFEFSVGASRVIVSCGQHRSDPMWQDLLSATSAHSTLTIDHTDNRPARGKVAPVDVARHEAADGTSVAVTHDGYSTRSGFVHARRLFLSADGGDLRGEDDLSVAIPPVMPLPYTVRFHLHPRVSVAPLQSGREAILKLPDGLIWRFAHDGEAMTIEDSVYLGATGLPQKTRQIVISGQIYAARKTVRWAIRQEG